MILAFLIIIWLFKIIGGIVPKKPVGNTDVDRAIRTVLALMWPLLALGEVFIWNTWASHWINWPQVTTLQQYLVTMIFL